MHLLGIPPPSTWSTSQVANVIAIVSATATVAALWYAFFRNRQVDKRVNDLENITLKLAEQNDLLARQIKLQQQTMKHLATPSIHICKSSFLDNKSFNLILENRGSPVTIQKINADWNIKFDSRLLPFGLQSKDTFDINGDFDQAQDKSNLEFLITIDLKDFFGNNYSGIIRFVNRFSSEFELHEGNRDLTNS